MNSYEGRQPLKPCYPYVPRISGRTVTYLGCDGYTHVSVFFDELAAIDFFKRCGGA